MEFSFSAEQEMIRDTAQAFLSECSLSASVRAAMVSEAGYDPALWSRICNEMGWSALLVPEEHGGLGLGFVELVAIMEQMGRYLLCSPFFASACLGVLALRSCADGAQQSEWLPRLAAGETATLVYDGLMDRRRQRPGVCARREAGRLVLSGDCRFVPNGHTSDWLLVVAEADDASLLLCVVPRAAPGIRSARLPTMDQTRPLATVTLDNVSAVTSATMTLSTQQLENVLDYAAIALAADQVGGAQQSLDSSVAYTRERVQFGRAIASYQAIKHKAADMMLKVEAARSAVYYAACIADEALADAPLGAQLAEAASVAKAYSSEAYFFCAGSGLQMHGGVGFTEEYDIQLYFKRARSTAHFLGDSDWHRERIAALLLDAEVTA